MFVEPIDISGMAETTGEQSSLAASVDLSHLNNFTGTARVEVRCRAATGERARWVFDATVARDTEDVALLDAEPNAITAPTGPIDGAVPSMTAGGSTLYVSIAGAPGMTPLRFTVRGMVVGETES